MRRATFARIRKTQESSDGGPAGPAGWARPDVLTPCAVAH